jgi:hypothetical protein
MGNLCVQPRCCSCTTCCSKAVAAKTMSLTIAGMAPISGGPCNCTLLNTTYVFGTPSVIYPFSADGRRLCTCTWTLSFNWACTTAGHVATSLVYVCILYNGTAGTIGTLSCGGFDAFGSGLLSGHTRIGVSLGGASMVGVANELYTNWMQDYSSQIDCAIISSLSIPFLSDPFIALRKCVGSGATATLNLV